MVLYEKKLYVALIVILFVFLYYNLALEKIVEDEIQEITDSDKEANQLKDENTTEIPLETTKTDTISTTSASTTRKWLSELV